MQIKNTRNPNRKTIAWIVSVHDIDHTVKILYIWDLKKKHKIQLKDMYAWISTKNDDLSESYLSKQKKSTMMMIRTQQVILQLSYALWNFKISLQQNMHKNKDWT